MGLCLTIEIPDTAGSVFVFYDPLAIPRVGEELEIEGVFWGVVKTVSWSFTEGDDDVFVTVSLRKSRKKKKQNAHFVRHAPPPQSGGAERAGEDASAAERQG